MNIFKSLDQSKLLCKKTRQFTLHQQRMKIYLNANSKLHRATFLGILLENFLNAKQKLTQDVKKRNLIIKWADS